MRQGAWPVAGSVPASGEQFVSANRVVETTTANVRIELAQETLRQFGFLRMRATGSSMLPAIAPGDLLTFRACSADQAQPGQVVLLRRSQGLVAHRLVACEGALLTTRGDALAATDEPAATASLLGVLVGQERGLRNLQVGGRYWLRRQRAARWLIQRFDAAHRLLNRMPVLVRLAA